MEVDTDISSALLGLGDPSIAVESNGGRRSQKSKIAGQIIPDIDESDLSENDGAYIAGSLAAAQRQGISGKGKPSKKRGGFQSMGLNVNLLKAITKKGFSLPTPIQRKTIPLIMDGRDVVGMARTGSGKTAAFVIPMIEKLKSHSARFGARALILSPSRELALQTLKVTKEMSRDTDLTSALLVGGDSLEEQFGIVTANPDIIIATPGRFLHLKVEMNLDMSSMEYIVFDEADRLFEMGFAVQLTEILHGLPTSRQTLLFSATLPKSLVEFARAGLQEPELVRLDAESKISPDLQSAFFSLKGADKEGALLHILSDVIKMPMGETEAGKRARAEATGGGKKRMRNGATKGPDTAPIKVGPSEHSTIVFAATKHHVEYLASILRETGYAVSYAYGSLDQTARKMQVQDFRSGISTILVVTDVAARGIDIPILANVINYDFPAQPKIFVHRVGRTARAGKQGWSYSLVRAADAPYLLDLQLFLGKRLILSPKSSVKPSYVDDVVVGALAQNRVESSAEWVNKLIDDSIDIQGQRQVAERAEKLYLRTRNSASTESARRAKELVAKDSWSALHPLFRAEVSNSLEDERVSMLARLSSFRPAETIFELGVKGSGGGEALEVLKRRRVALERQRKKSAALAREVSPDSERETSPAPDSAMQVTSQDADEMASAASSDSDSDAIMATDANMDSASDNDLEVTFTHHESVSKSRRRKAAAAAAASSSTMTPSTFQSTDFFMSYNPSNTNAAEDRAYGVHTGGQSKASSSNAAQFLTAAQSVTMDLVGDEGRAGANASGSGIGAPSRLRWDKRARKYISTADDMRRTSSGKVKTSAKDGASVQRGMIRSESGQKIAASFKSGRFDAWRKKNRVGRVGVGGGASAGPGTDNKSVFGKRYRHQKDKAPLEPDRYRDDYYKKRKLVDKAKEERRGRFRDGARAVAGEPAGAVTKSVEAVRKERKLKDKNRSRSGGAGRGGGRGGRPAGAVGRGTGGSGQARGRGRGRGRGK